MGKPVQTVTSTPKRVNNIFSPYFALGKFESWKTRKCKLLDRPFFCVRQKETKLLSLSAQETSDSHNNTIRFLAGCILQHILLPLLHPSQCKIFKGKMAHFTQEKQEEDPAFHPQSVVVCGSSITFNRTVCWDLPSLSFSLNKINKPTH